MKKSKQTKTFPLASLPWSRKESQEMQACIRSKLIPDIPYREELTFLAEAAEQWFSVSFKLNPPGCRDFDAAPFWEQFKKIFGKIQSATLGQRLMKEHAKSNAVELNKHTELSQRLQKASSDSEKKEIVAQLLRLALLETSQLDELLHKLGSIRPVWAWSPPASMNADAMEYLLCGFLFGRFLEVAKTVRNNRKNPAGRTQRQDQALDAVRDRAYSILSGQPGLTPSKFQRELCTASFDGFIVRSVDIHSERDQNAKYRKRLEVIFDDNERFTLPRTDQLLTEARKLLPKRRFGRSS